jgi:hypothetical protein
LRSWNDLTLSQRAFFLLPFPSFSPTASIGNSIQEPSCRGRKMILRRMVLYFKRQIFPLPIPSLSPPASIGEANIFTWPYP